MWWAWLCVGLSVCLPAYLKKHTSFAGVRTPRHRRLCRRGQSLMALFMTHFTTSYREYTVRSLPQPSNVTVLVRWQAADMSAPYDEKQATQLYRGGTTSQSQSFNILSGYFSAKWRPTTIVREIVTATVKCLKRSWKSGVTNNLWWPFFA